MNEVVTYRLSDRIARITLDDGKRNAMSRETLGLLHQAFEKAEKEAKAVTLVGRPGVFSAGFDLQVFGRGDPDEIHGMVRLGAELALRIFTFPLPVVVGCTGHAYPMGAFLLLSADHRLCADADLRIQLNEVQVGLTMPRFAVALCRQRLVPASVHAAVATARPFSPAEAMSAGFVDELVDPATLLSAAREHALRMAAYPMPAFDASKRRLVAPALQALEQAIADDVADWRAQSITDT